MNKFIYEDVSALRSRDYWSALAGKKVLITGATGMLGANLAYGIALNSRTTDLFLLCRNEQEAKRLFRDIDCEFLFQDVREPLQSTVKMDFIIHTAGPVGPKVFQNTPLEVISTNVEGTLSLIDYARRNECQGFVFASSHEVYGAASAECLESVPTSGVDINNARSCYILAKQAAENSLICAAKQYGLRAMSARLSRLYGPLMNLASGLFICDFVQDILASRPLAILGGQDLIRPLCYTTDAVDAILHILVGGKAGEAYNVQGHETPTIATIAQGIATISHQTVSLRAAEGKSNPNKGHWLNCNKLRSLGWEQTTALDIGLERTIQYFLRESLDMAG
jgi:nucleoside-diphosphate-sugar epimerase